MIGPSPDQALQLALMVTSGMPMADAIRYFIPADMLPENLTGFVQLWEKSKVYAQALLTLMGAPWHKMAPEQRWKYALEKQYMEMAYFLSSHNHGELKGQAKQKAHTCRLALEAKLAGTAGKLNALEQFYDDVRTGKLKLAPSPTVLPA